MNERLNEISEQIRTQDNLCTSDPLFVVERKVRDYGIDADYTDLFCWREDDRVIYEGDRGFKGLENRHFAGKDTGNWQRIGYRERWEFVTACFTRAGCEAYLKRNGHNLGKTRIYVHSAYRNDEFIDVREFLLGLTEKKGAA